MTGLIVKPEFVIMGKSFLLIINLIACFVQVSAQKPDSKISCNKTIIRFRCAATASANPSPIFIIDGIPFDSLGVAALNPDNIESIMILKESEIKAMSCNGPRRSVVVITTKKANERTIYVKDFLSRDPLPGASVDICSIDDLKNRIHLIADSNGKINTKDILLKGNWEILVTHCGYESYTTFLNSSQIGKGYTILLEREYKNLGEVKVGNLKNKVGFKSFDNELSCMFRCLVAGITITTHDQHIDSIKNQVADVKIYPNPAKAGATIIIESKRAENGDYSVQLFDLQGQCIHSFVSNANFEKNRISYRLPNIIAGGYFLKITNRKTNKQQTEKIIIQ